MVSHSNPFNISLNKEINMEKCNSKLVKHGKRSIISSNIEFRQVQEKPFHYLNKMRGCLRCMPKTLYSRTIYEIKTYMEELDVLILIHDR